MEKKMPSKTFELTMKQLLLASVYWAAIMAVAIFVPATPIWITVPVVLIGLIGIMGLSLSVAFKIPSDNFLELGAYSAMFGLAYMLIGGLFINYLLPVFGILHPLAAIPAGIFFEVSLVALSVWNYFYRKNSTIVTSFQPSTTASIWFAGIAVLFIPLSSLGAIHLNNGGNGTLTIIMLAATALYVVVLTYWNGFVQEWVYVIALYAISLAVLLMYSLRSAHIIGWDINQEYEVFQTTLQHLAWHASYYAGLDYNACLSITILPTMFAQLTRVSSEYVFKVVFQILFALSPVLVYVFAKRYIKSILAFFAAFLFLSQTWFFEQMPGLIRQEAAFIFFIALLLALFDDRLKRNARYVVIAVASIGVILTHYSTAYVTILLVIVAIVVSYLARWIRPFKTQQVVLKPVIAIGMVLALLIWQVPVTRTIGKVGSFVTNSDTTPAAVPAVPVPVQTPAVMTTQSPDVAPLTFQDTVPKTSFLGSIKKIVSTSFFIAPSPNNDQLVTSAKDYAVGTYYYQFYPDDLTAQYPSHAVDPVSHVPSALPPVLSAVIATIVKIVKLLAVDVAPLVGIYVMYREFRKTQSSKTYRMLIMGVSGCLLIATMIVVPYLQSYYNLTRLFLQIFLFLSVFAITGATFLAKRLKHSELLLAVLLVVMFLASTGVVDQFIGGPARLTLNQPPSTMDGLYIHDAEIAGAHWLMTSRNYDDPVEADAEANLRLQAFAHMSSANTAVFPETIAPKGYVYVSTNNIASGTASYQFNNVLLTFNYPFAFLQQHKDLIYNSGGSEIYH